MENSIIFYKAKRCKSSFLHYLLDTLIWTVVFLILSSLVDVIYDWITTGTVFFQPHLVRDAVICLISVIVLELLWSTGKTIVNVKTKHIQSIPFCLMPHYLDVDFNRIRSIKAKRMLLWNTNVRITTIDGKTRNLSVDNPDSLIALLTSCK